MKGGDSVGQEKAETDAQAEADARLLIGRGEGDLPASPLPEPRISELAKSALAVVSISGGKDSTATAIAALEALDHDRVVLVHFDTGNEHEITEEYVRDYLPRRLNKRITILRAEFSVEIARKRLYIEQKWPKKGVPDEAIKRALSVLHPTGVPFLDLCLWKGRFPSRMAQFCTQELKRQQSDKFMFDLAEERGVRLDGLASWQGIRRAESANREDALDEEWAAEGWLIVRPIASWTAQETVDYVLSRSVELNPLYRMGMGRVGCMPCINCTKDELAEIARRFPHHIDKIREWENLLCFAAKRGWTTFFTDGVEDGITDAEIFERFRIDSRVEWAKTSRGGKQYDLLKSGPPPMCSSMYGLCE